MDEILYGKEMPIVHAILYLLLGMTFSLAGYRLYRSGRRIYGLLLGFFLGLLIGAVTKDETTAIICATVGGLLGSLVMPHYYFIGLYITGGLAGGLALSLPLVGLHPASHAPTFGALLMGFVLGGIVAVRWEKASMVLLTSLYGAAIASLGLNGLNISELHLGPHLDGRAVVWVWSVWAILARALILASGIAVQSTMMKKLDKRKPITQYW